jgi:RND family efflux transporter MFP subunit
VSVSDAQVTQALGSLRAAQANLAKTIFRSPISGTVNELNVQLGDFVGSFDQIALVANNNALEVVSFVGDLERDQLVEGDVVSIDGSATGTITTIAPSIDAETRKTEVRIATDNQSISNGDTVRITKNSEAENRLTQILLPLSAIKFEAADGFVMQVDADGVVTQKSVTLGPIRGSLVEVTSGLEATEQFIEDVRGLTAGTRVSVRN